MHKAHYYLQLHGKKPNCTINLYTDLPCIRSAGIRVEGICRERAYHNPARYELYISPLYDENEVLAEIEKALIQSLKDYPPETQFR